MSGWLLAIEEEHLRQSSEALRRSVESADAAAWRSFWVGQRAIHGAGAADEMLDQPVPHADSSKFRAALRVLGRLVARRRADLWERAWHVQYPALSDEEAGFAVSESEEYDIVGLNVFTTSAAPPGLEFLDGTPNVATNWISLVAVRRLWELEVREGMLGTVGQHLSQRGTPLGHDLLVIREMLEFCLTNGAALYLWDPGS